MAQKGKRKMMTLMEVRQAAEHESKKYLLAISGATPNRPHSPKEVTECEGAAYRDGIARGYFMAREELAGMVRLVAILLCREPERTLQIMQDEIDRHDMNLIVDVKYDEETGTRTYKAVHG